MRHLLVYIAAQPVNPLTYFGHLVVDLRTYVPDDAPRLLVHVTRNTAISRSSRCRVRPRVRRRPSTPHPILLHSTYQLPSPFYSIGNLLICLNHKPYYGQTLSHNLFNLKSTTIDHDTSGQKRFAIQPAQSRLLAGCAA
jgi:hypothetical protein